MAFIDIKGVDISMKSIIILGLVAYIILMHTCSYHHEGDTTGETQKDTVSHSVDSVRLHHTDTVKDTIKLTKADIEPDTVYITEEDSSSPEHEVRTSYKDSLIKADVSTKLIGKFKGQSLDYELLSPRKTITNTDTIKITESTTVERTKKDKRAKWLLGAGLELDGSRSSFDIAPQVSLERDGVEISYSYNVLRKSHRIGLEKKFSLTSP